jgi:hypothetical protein
MQRLDHRVHRLGNFNWHRPLWLQLQLLRKLRVLLTPEH